MIYSSSNIRRIVICSDIKKIAQWLMCYLFIIFLATMGKFFRIWRPSFVAWNIFLCNHLLVYFWLGSSLHIYETVFVLNLASESLFAHANFIRIKIESIQIGRKWDLETFWLDKSSIDFTDPWMKHNFFGASKMTKSTIGIFN